MVFLKYLNKKNIFKQKKIIILFISIIIFSFVYYHLNTKHFKIKSSDIMNYFNSLYFSIVTQTLLGPGDIYPQTDVAKFFIIIQVTISLIITFLYI
jgi:hypothetical protein